MKKKVAILAVVAGLAVARGMPTLAHHSFAAEFDINKPVILKGTLVKLEWINPHGWLHMEVKNPDGKVVTWAVEAGAPNSLLRRGVRQTDFAVGTGITVEGYQAKDGSPKANGITVKFADGRDFFMGSSGTGAPEPAKKTEK